MEQVLSPIECVTEDITKRMVHLQNELRPFGGVPKLKTLNQVLSGSVNMQVHGGLEEVSVRHLTCQHPRELAVCSHGIITLSHARPLALLP